MDEKFPEKVHTGKSEVQGDDLRQEVKQPEQKESFSSQPQEEVEFRFGYTVGVDTEGKFVFHLLGNDRGFVQLLGLTKFAEQQISTLMDANLGQGLPRINAGLAVLNAKLEELLKRMNTEKDG